MEKKILDWYGVLVSESIYREKRREGRIKFLLEELEELKLKIEKEKEKFKWWKEIERSCCYKKLRVGKVWIRRG